MTETMSEAGRKAAVSRRINEERRAQGLPPVYANGNAGVDYSTIPQESVIRKTVTRKGEGDALVIKWNDLTVEEIDEVILNLRSAKYAITHAEKTEEEKLLAKLEKNRRQEEELREKLNALKASLPA